MLPTPAAPLLIDRYGLGGGVVISACHNPYRDNGVKFFGGDGFKLSDETEAEIEAALRQGVGPGADTGPRHAAPRRAGGLPARAARALRATST